MRTPPPIYAIEYLCNAAFALVLRSVVRHYSERFLHISCCQRLVARRYQVFECASQATSYGMASQASFLAGDKFGGRVKIGCRPVIGPQPVADHDTSLPYMDLIVDCAGFDCKVLEFPLTLVYIGRRTVGRWGYHPSAVSPSTRHSPWSALVYAGGLSSAYAAGGMTLSGLLLLFDDLPMDRLHVVIESQLSLKSE